jgi:hypothetical protein
MERKNQLKSMDVITAFIPIHDVIAVLGASIHQPIVSSSANNFKYIFFKSCSFITKAEGPVSKISKDNAASGH